MGRPWRQKIIELRRSLPIASAEVKIVEEVRNNDVLIIVGETGSGKTTQLPQYLFKAGFCSNEKVIGITQPRRVAAITVAKRVADECGCTVGEKVGYAIRFDDATSRSTRIKYMTDGLLLREALLDPSLSKYSAIIVDEAHERTLHTDVLLGFLKKIQVSRSSNKGGRIGDGHSECHASKCQEERHSPLKLIVMSASLDARIFSEYFGGATALHVQGRQFPVEIFYTAHVEQDYVDAALIAIFQIHLEEARGDILVFLTGQEEIEAVERLVRKHVQQLPEKNRNLVALPIFASLPSEKQMRVFEPASRGYRKVILATNIAETSVTIPGVRYVIDPGLVKARTYDPRTGMESLVIVKTSKAQSFQRSGRAGRDGPGKCYRLYPEREFGKLNNSTVPEIKRCNLSSVILQLKALGVDDVAAFDFIEKPNRTSIVKSLEQLLLLGALMDDGKLSNPVGQLMASLPLDPTHSKALILAGRTFDCLDEMLVTVAMLSVESVFYTPRDMEAEGRNAIRSFLSPEGDHATLINVYRSFDDHLRNGNDRHPNPEKTLKKWCKQNFVNSKSLRHARDVHTQLEKQVRQVGMNTGSCGDDMFSFRRCLAASFFLNAATRQPDGTYRVLRSGEAVEIHPTSVLFRKKAECVVFNDFVRTSRNFIRNLTSIDIMWLPELAPQYYAVPGSPLRSSSPDLNEVQSLASSRIEPLSRVHCSYTG